MRDRLTYYLLWCHDSPRVWLVFRLMLCLGGLLWAGHALAGSDVLEGTMSDVNATIQGNGRKWIYLIEGVSALIAYRSTKNIYVLGSVIAVAIFINVLLAMSK